MERLRSAEKQAGDLDASRPDAGYGPARAALPPAVLQKVDISVEPYVTMFRDEQMQGVPRPCDPLLRARGYLKPPPSDRRSRSSDHATSTQLWR